jgi:gliding motility-associated-like protein
VGGFGALNDMWRYSVVANEWTWMSGSGIADHVGSFGTIQIASATNLPPARYESAARWIDNAGNLWLFSGFLGNSNLPAPFTQLQVDDMWMFNVGTNEWTWMSGQQNGPVAPNYGALQVPAATNTPGARSAYSNWKDKQGNFWFFGGVSENSQAPTFGDMWMYDPVTNIWTWMAGSSIPNLTSTFTQQCVEGNGIPGAVYENRCCWVDDCGRFWNFGGFDWNQNNVTYNTLWVFDPNTLLFTWVNGTLTPNQGGNFGTQNVPAATNHPPALAGGSAFRSVNGDIWMFGGQRQSGSLFNTLWRYQIDPNCPTATNSLFTTLPNDTGCAPYTVQFVPASSNEISYSWDFGEVNTLIDTSTLLSPTWTYDQPGSYTATLVANGNCGYDTSTLQIVIHAPPSVNLGNDTTLCTNQPVWLNPAVPGTYLWNTGAVSSTLAVSASGAYSVQVTDVNNCTNSDTILLSLLPLPVIDLGSDTTICAGESLSLSAGTYTSYLWSTGSTAPSIQVADAGDYSLEIVEGLCSNSDTIRVTVDRYPIDTINKSHLYCDLILDAGNAGATYLWNTGETTQTIYPTVDGLFWVTITNGNCVRKDSIVLTDEIAGGILYIPNAFTPDENGNNDWFMPMGEGISNLKMAIFNRWGDKIFETNSMTTGWDGRLPNGELVLQDVYVYVIHYTSICSGKVELVKTGSITVIR